MKILEIIAASFTILLLINFISQRNKIKEEWKKDGTKTELLELKNSEQSKQILDLQLILDKKELSINLQFITLQSRIDQLEYEILLLKEDVKSKEKLIQVNEGEIEDKKKEIQGMKKDFENQRIIDELCKLFASVMFLIPLYFIVKVVCEEVQKFNIEQEKQRLDKLRGIRYLLIDGFECQICYERPRYFNRLLDQLFQSDANI